MVIRYVATVDWVFVRTRKLRAFAMTTLPLAPSFLPTYSSSSQSYWVSEKPKTTILLLHPFTLNPCFSENPSTTTLLLHLSSASVRKCQQVTPVQGTHMDLITVISKLLVECFQCASVSCPWSSTFPTQERILDVGFGSVAIGWKKIHVVCWSGMMSLFRVQGHVVTNHTVWNVY